tara:strand:- start:72 stop:980 length:909 start_codon:yes stop_codon:yes gene_type:complete
MYSITALRQIKNTKNPIYLDYSFDKLAQFLTLPRKGYKTSKHSTIPAWSPAKFNGRGVSNEHVVSVSCMVYDIDDGLQFDNHEKFHPFQYIAYTSPSHTFDHHKWRLVIPLDEPIPRQYWKLVWDDMINYFEIKTNTLMNGGKIDLSCKDERRFYFLGRESKHFESHVNDQGYNFWVNLPEIIERKKQRDEAQRKALEIQKQKLRDAMKRPGRNRDAYNELRMQLNLDDKYRTLLAQRIGARITGGANPRAVGWECPRCKRSDCTFYYINPMGNKLGAFCNHRNSCGFSSGLFELGRLKGVF